MFFIQFTEYILLYERWVEDILDADRISHGKQYNVKCAAYHTVFI